MIINTADHKKWLSIPLGCMPQGCSQFPDISGSLMGIIFIRPKTNGSPALNHITYPEKQNSGLQ